MKLSFNSSKKPTTRPLSSTFKFGVEDNAERAATQPAPQYVTRFNSSESLADDPNPKTLDIIPPKPNEWRPMKKMKNLDLPLQEQQPPDLSKFESQSKSLEDEANRIRISYGLTLRRRANGGESSDGGMKPKEPEPVRLESVDDSGVKLGEEFEKSGDDLETSNGEIKSEEPEPVKPESVDDARIRLREELEKLGDDPGYEDLPVERFGAALLRGLGWSEGKAIGRNRKGKEDIKVKLIERHDGRFGIGFQPPEKLLPEVKGRENREGKEGRGLVGKEVRIVGGNRESLIGLKGKIVEVVGDERVVLKVSEREEQVRVRIEDFAELGSAEEDRFLKKMRELRIRSGSNGNSKSKRSREEVSRDFSNAGGKRDDHSKVGWLIRHIRVRVISQNLKGGRLYRKKGEVVDVVGPTICDVLMDESKELIQGVDQEYLETALPKRGGPVFVLSGRHKGIYGSLVDRDLDRETGVVRDTDTQEFINVQLEQIAEYVGDPSMIGY